MIILRISQRRRTGIWLQSCEHPKLFCGASAARVPTVSRGFLGGLSVKDDARDRARTSSALYCLVLFRDCCQLFLGCERPSMTPDWNIHCICGITINNITGRRVGRRSFGTTRMLTLQRSRSHVATQKGPGRHVSSLSIPYRMSCRGDLFTDHPSYIICLFVAQTKQNFMSYIMGEQKSGMFLAGL